eukprot:scaffold5574_cov126-Isochrysis_galbana.AAC.7
MASIAIRASHSGRIRACAHPTPPPRHTQHTATTPHTRAQAHDAARSSMARSAEAPPRPCVPVAAVAHVYVYSHYYSTVPCPMVCARQGFGV